MEVFRIEKISVDQILQLVTIAQKVFRDTFAVHNSEGDLQKYFDEKLSVEKLTEEIMHPESAFYFVYEGDKPVGYLKLNTGSAQTELKEDGGLEVERIYVLYEHHGKGYATALMNKAIGVATSKNIPFIWLGVWEENQRAIRFYKKFGFEAFSTHIFVLGDDEQTDLLMKKVL